MYILDSRALVMFIIMSGRMQIEQDMGSQRIRLEAEGQTRLLNKFYYPFELPTVLSIISYSTVIVFG